MTVMLLLNLLLAVAFASSRGGLNPFNLFIGFLLGFFVLWIGKPIFRNDQYFPRMKALCIFGLTFVKELILATYSILKAVLFRRRRDMHPNLLTYSVEGMEKWEILLLSQCITLTPGTTTVEVDSQLRYLVLHAFDAQDPEAVRKSIDQGLKAPLLRWSRPC